MKKLILVIFFLKACMHFCFCQNIFRSFYTKPNQSALGNSKSVLQTKDGGYIVFHMGMGLTKYDSAGNFVWGNLYGSSQLYYGQSANTILELNDRSILFWGHTIGHGETLMRVDSVGNLMFAKKFPFSVTLMSMLLAPDSNIILFGTKIKSTQSGDTIVIVMIKTTLNGNFMWQKDLAPDDHSTCVDLQATQDSSGNFFIAGSFSHYNVQSTNYYIQKVDSTGNILWSQNFDENYIGVTITGILLKDNEVYIQVYLRDSVTMWLVPDITKVSAVNGQIIWSKRYLEQLITGFQGMMNATSGKIICFGQTEDTYPNLNYVKMEIDSGGSIIDQKLYFLPGAWWDLYCGNFIETNDSGFIFCGSVGDNVKYPTLIKMDSLFQSPCFDSTTTSLQPVSRTLTQTTSGYMANDFSQITDVTSSINTNAIFLTRIDVCSTWLSTSSLSKNEFIISPNPVTDHIKIISGGPEAKKIKIFNLLGDEIYSGTFDKEFTIDCAKFPSGVYFVSLKSDKGISTQELIVE